MALDAGFNYQGRDGELRLLDKSQATATTAGTPWGIRVSFEQMDLNVTFRPRPPQNPRLDRERFNSLAHRQLGSDENLFEGIEATFSMHVSSRHTDAVLEFSGAHFANVEGTNASAWNVKGTPAAGLVSTLGRAKSGDGLYSGGILDGKGSVVALPDQADPKVVGVDAETLWVKRDGTEPFGIRMKECVFNPGQQRFAESNDFVTLSMTATVYGRVERISAFSRAMDVLTSRVMSTGLSSLD